jgi:hypothetical protein
MSRLEKLLNCLTIVYPLSLIFTKLVNKDAIKPPKCAAQKIHNPPEKMAKTSWTLSLDFQTECFYDSAPKKSHQAALTVI